MINSVIPASVLLLCSTFAFAAGGAGGGVGGVAGAAGGSHPSGAAHRGSSFDNPANISPGARARSGCLGAVAGVPSSGAPWPVAPRPRTGPSATNEPAIEGATQSNPNLPRLSQQDQRIIAAIKQANDRLGKVGNPTHGQTKNTQPGRTADVTGLRERVQRSDSGSFRPLIPPAQREPSEGEETTKRPSVQSKPDVSHMSEQSQRLAREVIRDTERLGKVGNPGSGDGRSQAQQDALAGSNANVGGDTNGPRGPMNTTSAAPRSC
jgi:hypothetical protein